MSDAADTAAKLAFLARPDSYPNRPATVETIETHLSWVFLTPTEVYKLKKPLRYGYLDFGSSTARRRNCEAEVELNQALAPGVYLGIQSLWRLPDGRLSLQSAGEEIDTLVHMRRLDEARNLRRKLREARPTAWEVDEAAGRLMDFYGEQPPLGRGNPAEMAGAIAAEAGELAQRLPELAPETAALADQLQHWLEGNPSLLEGRCIIEVHGDLRPQHVYLGDPPLFIDRLEFNRDLRMLDPLEELAFFAMECARLGGGWVGDVFLDHYRSRLDADWPRTLLGFYQARRALLWALLSARHPAAGPRWCDRARDYLAWGRSGLA